MFGFSRLLSTPVVMFANRRAAIVGFSLIVGSAGVVCPTLAAADTACAPTPPDIVGWWSLDEGAGASSAVDMIGGNHAVHVGAPAAQTGLVAGALHFDGVADCLSVADHELWNFGSDEFTFELWLKLDVATGGEEGRPGDVLVGQSEGPFNVDKYFFALAPGQIEFIAYSAATDTGALAPKAAWSPPIGQWAHVALTRSGATYRVYIDGELADTAQGLAVLPDPDTDLVFGCGQENWDGYLNGSLDEVAIYRRALTEQEIRSIADAGSAGKCLASSSTSTTLPTPLCADVNRDGRVTTTDALAILITAVGGAACDAMPCVCDVDGSGAVKTTDALIALRIAVGFLDATACPCGMSG